MEKFTKSIGQYVITILLVALGFFFLAKYLGSDELESQPTEMLIASITLVVVGILIAPPVMGKFGSSLSQVLMVLGVLFSAALAYVLVESITSEIDFQEQKSRIEARTIQRLKDIRDAQEAFADFNGKYTENFDTLLSWIKKDVVPIPFKMGTFHDSLSEVDYYDKGYVLRRNEVDSVAAMLGYDAKVFLEDIDQNRTAYKIIDTLYTSFYAENFTSVARKEKKLPPVYLDSLPFAPFKGGRFIVKTDFVEQGGVKQPTILVQDPHPFGRDKVKKDTLRFGSLTEPHTDGNWK